MLAELTAIKAALMPISDAAARTLRSCAGCGLCCEHPRNEMKATPAEALAVAVRLLDDPLLAARLPEIRGRIVAAIERYELRPVEDDGRTYTCPLLEEDRSCLVHGASQPLGCLAFMPFTTEHCDMRMELLERAGERVGPLCDDWLGEDGWKVVALPVALLSALDDLLSRG